MQKILARTSDMLVGLLVPQVKAQATTCSEVRSYCNGDCPFWWWRRAHYISCDDGNSWVEYERCGYGC